MPKCKVIFSSVTQQATAVELGRMLPTTDTMAASREVALLYDGVAQARARGRPGLTPGLRDARGGRAADVATMTRILALSFRGYTANECGFPKSTRS